MIFFQLGWGGEFTATSMIGWIALAGIIVRNSILLVDFSVHQIQQGDSVVDAVIVACKTRTRPILITALALVAGSSVIFFDPIFQGMAISLASGVLVSTILTLVVIPLGCVSAADSLCAVAGSTKCRKFPRGGGPDEGPGGGAKPTPRPGDPLWVRAWGGFASMLFTVVGLVAALVEWVGARVKSKPKAKPVAAVPSAPPAAQSAKPVAVSSEAPPSSPAEPTVQPAAQASEARPMAAAATPAPPVEAPSSEAKPAVKAGATRKAGTAQQAKKAKAKKPAGKKTASKKTASKKTTARKTGSKRVAVKRTGSEKAPVASQDVAPSGKGRAARPTDVPKAKSPATRKKTGGRRGIQLKTLGKAGGDGLN
jgi:hypothetical protein